jgi:selenocysteine lyase/cysteine desulfurase
MGERASFILVPMMIAALDLLLEWTVQRISSHCGKLTDQIADAVTEFGCRAAPSSDRAPHIIGLSLPDHVDRNALEPALDDRKVLVSWRGNVLRVSPHLYNSDTDVQTLIDAIASIVVKTTARS